MTTPREPLSAAELDELAGKVAAMTEGKWQWLDSGGDPGESDELQDGRGEMVATGFRDALLPDITDGRGCAALRNAAEELIRGYRLAQEALEALRVVAAIHVPDPEGGHGYLPEGGYGGIDPACRECGTSDEYAVPWPCRTAETVRALTNAAAAPPFLPQNQEALEPLAETYRAIEKRGGLLG